MKSYALQKENCLFSYDFYENAKANISIQYGQLVPQEKSVQFLFGR